MNETKYRFFAPRLTKNFVCTYYVFISIRCQFISCQLLIHPLCERVCRYAHNSYGSLKENFRNILLRLSRKDRAK